MGRHAGVWIAAVLLGVSACSAAGATAADPRWTPLPSASLSDRVERPGPDWVIEVPASSPVRGGFLTARSGWFTVATTVAEGQVPVVSIAAGDAVHGTLEDRALEVRGAVGQPLVFDLHGRPVAVLPVRRDPTAQTSVVDETAYDVRSGRVLWRRPASLDEPVDPSSYFHIWGTADGLIIGQINGDEPAARRCGVCALDLASGRTVWSSPGTPAPGPVAMNHIAVDAGTVAASESGGSRLVVLDARTGRVRFVRGTTAPPNGQWPVVLLAGDAVVSVVDGPGDGDTAEVDVYGAGDGSPRWHGTTTQLPKVDRASTRIVLVDASGGLSVRALDASGASWAMSAEQARRDAVAVQYADDGRVVATSRGQVVAWDSRDGHAVWAGMFARPNANQWDGRRYVAWASEGRLAAYASTTAPLGVDISGQGEIPLFAVPRSG
jgi:outer membrane protein assembly factor BamB